MKNMFPMSADELCSKLNPILTAKRKCVLQVIEVENGDKNVNDKFKGKLVTINFTEYKTTEDEKSHTNPIGNNSRNLDNSNASGSGHKEKERNFDIDILTKSLADIVIKPSMKRTLESVSLIFIAKRGKYAKVATNQKVFKQSTEPDTFIEIIYPPCVENVDDKEDKERKKGESSSNSAQQKYILLPVYLKVKEKRTGFVFVRPVSLSNKKDAMFEELFKAIAETITFPELLSHKNYKKVNTPYNLVCRDRYEKSKLAQKKQTSSAFTSLEAVQDSSMGGVSVRRQCPGNSVHTKKIPLVPTPDLLKLIELRNHVAHMMPSYIRHEIPQVEILQPSVPSPDAEEKEEVRSWLQQFKS